MCMKGHNAISPCCMCNIQGVCIPSSSITTHYTPLNCNHFPGVNPGYEAHSLPLQNHNTLLKQAVEVQTALTSTASERLATKYGIKGLPLLSALTSLSFPLSFPYNFMHLIWSNLIVNLIHLWTAKFKNLDHDNEEYVLMPTVMRRSFFHLQKTPLTDNSIFHQRSTDHRHYSNLPTTIDTTS